MFAVFCWLALLIVFLAVEGSTVTLVSIWFAVGSLAAIVAALLSAPLWLQVVIFFAVSTVMLALLRPIVRKYLKPKITATNVDSVVGSQGYVTQDIDNLTGRGQVKLGSRPWTARSADGRIIQAGSLVRVERIEGVKVFVTPVLETADI